MYAFMRSLLLTIAVILPLGAQQDSRLAWAPVPAQPATWVAPNRPLWKLADLLAQHKGQSSWTQTVVSDSQLHADYISMAPGAKTPREFHPDTRAWWIVQDGQIRFTIEGQEPFVASKGYLVQVPYRTIYTLDGVNFVKVRIEGRGKYDQGNKPYIDFNAVVAGTEKQRRFIADDRAVANIIIGDPKKQRPAADSDKGHFHEESPEFWFILLGKMEYKIGSLPIFIADQGDIVYTPKQTWHRARFGGADLACRLAMNGYQDLLHNYQPPD
jgi:mannose-6-phosphate isomerase-like protein (cupin superfamily)